MRRWPARLFFFCNKSPGSGNGGRTFIHSALEIESRLQLSVTGRSLLERLRKVGMKLEFGYLHKGTTK